MDETFDIQLKIEEIESELSGLDNQRSQLVNELMELRRQLTQNMTTMQLKFNFNAASLNNQSPQDEKVHLFRSLFKGGEISLTHVRS